MNLSFNNYYLTMFGELDDIDSVISLIDFLSEVNFEYRLGDDYFIATFSSFLGLKELEDLLRGFKSDYVLTEIGEKFVYGFMNKKEQDELFGLIYNENEKISDITNKLIEDITEPFLKSKTETPKNEKAKNEKPKKKAKPRRQKRLKSEYYKNLSKKEKEEMINNILDKGFDNISDYDRRVLSIISKSE